MGEVLGHGFFGQVYRVSVCVAMARQLPVLACVRKYILSMLAAGSSQGNGEGDGNEEDGEVHRRGKERIFERGEQYSRLPPLGDYATVIATTIHTLVSSGSL